jgi:hypothetical protein
VGFVNDPDVKLLVLIILGAGLAVALWYFWDDIRPPVDEPVIIQTAPVDAEQRGPREPIHPIAPLSSMGSIDGELVPLPPLDESDSYFLLALVDVFGADIGRMLVNEALVDKFVATVDNLTRSHVSEKIWPVDRLSGTFVVDATGNTEPFYLSSDNYQRFDVLVNLMTRADLDVVAEMYRRFYPLFQESYVRLGYPNGYFNDRVVEVIDHMLRTPQPAEPIQLVRPHVLYEFADPELEALSSGQKLLLRTGSDHSARIKSVLRDLRVLVTQAAG